MRSPLRWSIILVPIVLIGIIELLSDSVLDEALPFPFDTIVVLTVVSILTVLFGILGFRRIDALTGTLDRRNAELQDRVTSARTLHRVSVAVAALADIDAVLDVVVANARTLLRADVAFLLLADADGSFRLRARSGPPSAFRSGADGQADRPGDEQVGRPDHGELDASDALRFVRQEFARGHLGAPLQRGDSTIGLLTVASEVPRAFSVDDVEALASLANGAAIALENARLQARLRELAVIDERERIAREMHDGLAQVLGYVNTKSQAIEEFLAAGRVPEARGHLAELTAAARSLYVDIREAILGLRSPIVGADGLVPAIETYASRFADASKLAVEVTATPEARRLELEPRVQAHTFRIVQEGLTNVRKHAAAHRARIALDVSGGALVVRLTDDGRGLGAPGQSGDAEWPRYGLAAMRERAQAIGGSVAWSEPPEGGTRVELSVPVSGAGASPAVRANATAGPRAD